MIARNAQGTYFRLVDRNGKELNEGDKVRDHRGAEVILKANCEPPPRIGMTGHVTIGEEARGYDRWVYPLVIGAKWEVHNPLDTYKDFDTRR